jgi:addiction module HigA family antidote
MTKDSTKEGQPSHPGTYVKGEVLEPLELSVTEAAEALGITRSALSTFLNGHSALSPEMGLRIEKAFGVSMDNLMRLQCSFDIAEARKREGDVRVLPYRPMQRPKRQGKLF